MKLILLIASLFFIGCKDMYPAEITKKATVDTIAPANFDSSYIKQEIVNKKTFDSLLVVIAFIVDSLKNENDSLKTKLFVSNYKLARVRRYWRITMNNPSQIKYLKGWIRRIDPVYFK